MLVFPQLNTGAAGEYPIVRRRRWTAVTNILPDGSMVNHTDSTPRTNAWELTLRDLTDAEADSIQQLFQAVEGRRGTFTFIDPTANLLAHSEELDNSCWVKDPMIQVTAGIADPLGGTRGLRLVNGGQGPQRLSQGLAAPAWFGYCFSVYARSTGGAILSLARSSSSRSQTRLFPLGPDWSRCALPGPVDAGGETLNFALEVPAGASVDVFGIQVEAQPNPSAYKRTGERNGIYTSARFGDDTLQRISDGPDQHRMDVRVVAKD